MLFVERLDSRRMRPRDVRVPHVFPHHRSILGFHQTVITAVPRPRFGLFDQELVQQLGNRMVNELAPVVGMKSPDAERKLCQHRVEHRQQVGLADLRRRSRTLPALARP